HSKLASDAQAAQKPVKDKVHHSNGPGTKPRENGVEQNGQHHGFDATEPIAHNAEDQSARAPADQENRSGPSGVLSYVPIGGADVKEVGYGILAGQREQVLVHAVGEPAQSSHSEDEIV